MKESTRFKSLLIVLFLLISHTLLAQAPVITSFSPASGSAGTVVTITGVNFTGTTLVSFGGVATASFMVISATTITAVIGAGSTGNVSATTPKGTGISSTTFTFISPPSLSSTGPQVYKTGLSVSQVVTINAGGAVPNNNYGQVTTVVNSSSSNGIRGIAIDPSANLYTIDYNNNVIRSISPGGTAIPLAGSGTPGFADGVGTAASFSNPIGLSIDAGGNLYVLDNFSLRQISPSKTVSTIAGNGSQGSVDAAGSLARFNNPQGLALDAADNIYIADGSKIRKVTSAGVVSTFAGKESMVLQTDPQHRLPFPVLTELPQMLWEMFL